MAGRLLERNEAIHRLFHETRWRIEDRLLPGPPVLVFSPGKSGTSSVAASLAGAHLGASVYHLHRLSEEGIHQAEEKRARRTEVPEVTPVEILAAKRLRRRLEGGSSVRPWRIVALVRDPVERAVSTFFQEHDLWAPGIAVAGGDATAQDVAALRERFLATFHEQLLLDWFERELEAVFGIDVYRHPFPCERGWRIYDNEKARALVIRLPDLDRSGAEAFRALLGVSGVKILHVNVSSEKGYRRHYRAFLEDFRIPAESLYPVYHSRLATHFFTTDEIESMWRRWSD